jgi:hypothetical protein
MSNTIEKNKAIAVFMGYEDKSKLLHGEDVMEKILSRGSYSRYRFDELNYHTNWVALMDVVEKINGLNNVVSINDNHVVVVNNTRGEAVVDVCLGSMIEATHEAVYEYIKNYKR